MKLLTPLFCLSALLGLASCIRDEAANAECDITGVDTLWLQAQKADGFLIGDPVVKNTSVSFTIRKGADRTAVAPVFTLTPGAALYMDEAGSRVPANGATRDFSSPQAYVTVSEDGRWSKEYSVSFTYPQPIGLCSFEHFGLNSASQYSVFYEIDPADGSQRNYWDSGNSGYVLCGMAKSPDEYPTRVEAAGHHGNCAKLVTLSTGSFGKGVNMPIAAGNLFIGEFRTAQAMIFPRQATRFGLQLVGGKPISLSGWYKYAAGPVYTDIKLNVVPEKHDTCDIYAVLYEVDPQNFTPLNGDDVLTSDRIAALARIDDPGEPQTWTYFSEPFREMNGKTFDEARLRNDGYAIAIVATSSRQGAYFEGAVGSTLYVDELRIEWDSSDNDDDGDETGATQGK